MKKLISLMMVACVLFGGHFAHATATRESSAKDALPVSMYGKKADGTVQSVRVNEDGSISKGTTPNSKAIAQETGDQLLSASSLDFTTAFSAKTQILSVFFHAENAITETVTISFDSKDTTQNTVVVKQDLVSEQDLTYIPSGTFVLEDGDELNVTCTNATATTTVHVIVKGETLN